LYVTNSGSFSAGAPAIPSRNVTIGSPKPLNRRVSYVPGGSGNPDPGGTATVPPTPPKMPVACSCAKRPPRSK
jgi:hypothetical protein